MARLYSSRKRILVTGGAGFLGSHLCDRLIDDGHEVLCVDNFFTGDKSNITHLLGHERFELLRHDITFPLFVEVDEIYNLACPASPIHNQHDPEIKVARIFNTYGPRMHVADGRVVSNFIVQALKGQPLTLYGDGKQTRSFCYVDDLVNGLVRMMDSPDEVTGPVNLGNPKEFSMAELASQVLAATGSKSKLTFAPLPADDPRQRQPDISRAKDQLGWEPRVGLDE